MTLIHTADVHLSKKHPERMKAFRQILDICEEEADILLISGDLFDANTDLDDLKTDLRPLLSDNSFETLVIPGNHDRDAFREDDYLGDSVTVLDERPFQRFETEDYNIIGVPYTNSDFSELLVELDKASVEDRKNILMIHCTLKGSAGEEDEYLPVRPDQLVETGFDYVLAGHIHSAAKRKKFQETVFAYPGSPASVSSSETGMRHVWRLDEGLKTVPLNSFHFVERDLELLPGDEDEELEKLREDLENESGEACAVVNVSGFTEENVRDLMDDVESTVENEGFSIRLNDNGLESVSYLVESELYSEFRDRLQDQDVKDEDKVEKKFLRALSRNER